MGNSHLKKLKCKRWLGALTVFFMLLTNPALARTYLLPTDGSTIIGRPEIVQPSGANTLLDIARHFDLGYHEITGANPDINVWTPVGNVVVPAQFILPPKPWTGVVLNISQRRLFYFPVPSPGKPAIVVTFPVSIAREGWSTPLGETRIVGKHKDPAWFVPKSIKAEHKAAGEEEFPDYFPPGEDNPMGMLAIQLGFKSIYIHGTNRPWGVGMRTSHGCLHLYPEDAVILFDLIKTGVPVRVIDEPVLVATQHNQLYMANYEPVQEYGTTPNVMTRAVLALAPYLQTAIIPKPDSATEENQPFVFEVDWNRVRDLLQRPQVLPVSLAPAGNSLQYTLNALIPVPYKEAPYGIQDNDASPPARTVAPLASPRTP